MNSTVDMGADFEVASPPPDGITDLAFCPQADLLAASSWDNNVRIYEVQPNGSTVPKASYVHEAPVFSVDWSKQGGFNVASGGADNAVRMFNVETGQTTQVGAHNDAVRCVNFLDSSNILASSSWDKTLKYWDLRSPTPVGTVNLPERAYSMDTRGNTLVVATADRHVLTFDLANPTNIVKTDISPLKYQTRCVTVFKDGLGYAISSIEGRVGVKYVKEELRAKEFSFKCHRDNSKNIYSINKISLHPIYGTISTCGSDGTISFWDKDSKKRLTTLATAANTISCTAFNRNGTIFAYAVSYDWTKGHTAYPAQGQINKIFLHAMKDEEIRSS